MSRVLLHWRWNKKRLKDAVATLSYCVCCILALSNMPFHSEKEKTSKFRRICNSYSTVCTFSMAWNASSKFRNSCKRISPLSRFGFLRKLEYFTRNAIQLCIFCSCSSFAEENSERSFLNIWFSFEYLFFTSIENLLHILDIPFKTSVAYYTWLNYRIKFTIINCL